MYNCLRVKFQFNPLTCRHFGKDSNKSLWKVLWLCWLTPSHFIKNEDLANLVGGRNEGYFKITLNQEYILIIWFYPMTKLAVWHGDPAQNRSSVSKAMEAFLGPQPILLYIPSLHLWCASSESRASSPPKFT